MRAKIAEQFASASRRNAPLHIDEVDASLAKQWFYAILYSKDGDIMASDKLSEQSMDFAVQNYIGKEQYNFLESKCKSLRAMLVSSINTAKNNNK